MTTPEVVHTGQAPAAVGPYSQAIRTSDLLFTSGQIGLDPETGRLIEGGVVAQCGQVMRNLEAVLTAGGSEFSRVVKSTIFLTSMEDFAAVNEVYARHFDGDPPARSTVAVAALPLGALVEIECVALVEA